jgi:hypothetical protein
MDVRKQEDPQKVKFVRSRGTNLAIIIGPPEFSFWIASAGTIYRKVQFYKSPLTAFDTLSAK